MLNCLGNIIQSWVGNEWLRKCLVEQEGYIYIQYGESFIPYLPSVLPTSYQVDGEKGVLVNEQKTCDIVDEYVNLETSRFKQGPKKRFFFSSSHTVLKAAVDPINGFACHQQNLHNSFHPHENKENRVKTAKFVEKEKSSQETIMLSPNYQINIVNLTMK